MTLASLEADNRLSTPAPSWSRARPDPILRRECVRWTGGTGGKPLCIELGFENPSRRLPTRAADAAVEVAPFGAFLRWSPLARVAVPPVPPGGRRVLTATLAGAAGLPPPPVVRGFPFAAGRLLMRGVGLGAHFAGNLNVHVSRTAPVERHVQGAVGLRPGRDNLALFSVGDGKPERYTFSIHRSEPGWDLEIPGHAWGVPVDIASATIPLRIRPAPRAESGSVSVLVARESTGQAVPVEFELDVAARSKCFFFLLLS